MIKHLFIFLLVAFQGATVHAGVPGNANDHADTSKRAHLRISILTGGPGEELWETFGHTCIRVIDSTKSGGERDVLYNYGFFETTSGSIWSQFLTGRVQVMLDTITYQELITEYVIKKRALSEQELLLSNRDKVSVLNYLKNNLQYRKRYYDYDTFYDNCTTRVRDLLRTVFGDRLAQGIVITPNSKLTFRDVSVNTFCPAQHKYWFGLGLNLLYSVSTDKVMDNHDAMFLATIFSDCLNSATLDGQKLCGSKTCLLPGDVAFAAGPDWPFIIFMFVFLLTAVGFLLKDFWIVGKIMSVVLLVATGLLGCLLLHLSLIDGEPAWKHNLNILWALPTNIIVPFLGAQIKRKYAVAALVLLGVSLLLDVLGVQEIPLYVITPILLALVLVYGYMYRKNKVSAIPADKRR